MKKAAAVDPEPAKKRKAPDFSGVPGKIVSLDGLDLRWGKKKLSPYDALLTTLSESPKGQVLRFESVRARASVSARAKKLGFRIQTAEADGFLFVRFEGRADDDVKGPRRKAILECLRKTPGSYITIANKLRDAGDTGLNAGDVEAIILQMQKEGSVIRQEGNSWTLNPKAPAVVRDAVGA